MAPFSGFAAAERESDALQMPPVAYPETFHRGKLPTTYSGLSLSAENVVVTAVKQHVSGKGTVIRFLECAGKQAAVDAELLGTRFAFSIAPYAVKTLWLSGGTVEETDFIE